MMVSTKGRYALKVMLDLATCPREEYISLKAISERQAISMKYLEAIVASLSKSELVESLRGKTGGYRLNKPLDAYRVGDILRAAEGELSVSYLWFELYRRLYAKENNIEYSADNKELIKKADEKYPLPKKLDYRMHD